MDGFKGMYNFLRAYYIRTSCASGEIREILDAMTISEQEGLLSSSMWHRWAKCVQKIVCEYE